ncbi:MAG TPA: hypothetical protein VMZ31_01435 [Phycisphaerae bacterium]|nr:hypothetical protein [Phycisphaerae bacterium]
MDDLPLVQPGERVKVVQTIRWRDASWHTELEGVVEGVNRQPTGSWFAHGQDGRLWLRRVQIRKDDGELVDLVLDESSRVARIDPEIRQ